ncbi:DNA polymerase III subunit beta [Thiomicrospira sp. R3]|uniref:DNA polymerase III subunit beta n=1 Tax=Thiomicrospira sp. R3 TaxID=3035472 RepID=UPI00259B279F|nr:DNA polymerase III subunit beta [Thiomicrospira sp. R3]WFE69635.1 DNA polymerase III subunit beta [Thiomicrospira sp. R3]
MKLTIQRENFLKALQNVAGVVEKRHTNPILGNFLFQVWQTQLIVTGSDSEIETRSQTPIESIEGEAFDTTLPAQKLLTIVRSLPEGLHVVMEFEEGRCTLKAGRSSFKLSTLPGQDYPHIDLTQAQSLFEISQAELKNLIQHCGFAMASQDVRFYLNGMLFDVSPYGLRLVATDGHRLSTCVLNNAMERVVPTQAIVPRKAVVELTKLLSAPDESVSLSMAKNYLTLQFSDTVFTCKLIDGRYPDYNRVLPKFNDVQVQLDHQLFKSILQRASILSNERFRGVRLVFDQNLLTVHAQNAEQDESNEDMAIDFEGDRIEIGFNVGYLLDVINSLKSEVITLNLKDSSNSCLITVEDQTMQCQHVIMPMRL